MHKTDPNIIRERIESLRELMNEEGISLYMISDADYHMSDVRSDYFNELEYMSGFTGYNGIMVVTAENAHLWTDARYIDSAPQELEETGIILHIESDENDSIRTIQKFFEAVSFTMLEDALGDAYDSSMFLLGMSTYSGEKYVIGFDGRTFSSSFIDEIMQFMTFPVDRGLMDIEAKVDLVAQIWDDRPSISTGEIVALSEEITGKSAADKIEELRDELRGYGSYVGAAVVAADDVAWLFNIRGTDAPYAMTAYAYAYVNCEDAYLFADESKITEECRNSLESQGITIKKYDEFYSFVETADDSVIMFDPDKTPFAFVVTADSASNHVIITRTALIDERKAIKTDEELEHAMRYGVYDSAAFAEAIYWTKRWAQTGEITESDVADKLQTLRTKHKAIRPSFPTVSAYQENSGDMNYVPSSQSDKTLKAEGVLLLDSGAHYEGATTDTTRTIALGPVTYKQKAIYTKVLASLLDVTAAKFPPGMTDAQLDVFAKKTIWEHGADVPHATGHGVGAMIDVQESIISVDWGKTTPHTPLQENMLIAIEPGLYFPDEFGIRLENMYWVSRYKNGYLALLPTTYVPFEMDMIDFNLLTDEQINTLNRYNLNVHQFLLASIEDEDIIRWVEENTEMVKPHGNPNNVRADLVEDNAEAVKPHGAAQPLEASAQEVSEAE